MTENENLIMLEHIDHVVKRLIDLKPLAFKNRYSFSFCEEIAKLLIHTEDAICEIEKSFKEVKQDGIR